MLERQHLAILVEVERQGSLTAAAEKLNLTQSALSHTIKRLEHAHGLTLWTKHGRRLRFTQAGRYLLEMAQRVLPQIEHTEQVLRDFSLGYKGSLRVGMECHPCQKWLARLTPHYLAQWPDVDFNIRTAFPFDGVAALRGHEIDLLITPDPIHSPDLVFVPVIDYELVLAVPAAHPLAARRYARPVDLGSAELITVPVSIDRLDVYSRFLLPANCRPRHRRTIETPELMLQLVAAGRGVTVLPDWLVDEEGAGLPIRKVSLGKTGLRKAINLGLRRDDENIDYIKGFVALAKRIGIDTARAA
ncbi:LysR family transcriptional regulator [Bordetella petrii]|nr:LysR family transcriptional regulator [Bordetella petrii]